MYIANKFGNKLCWLFRQVCNCMCVCPSPSLSLSLYVCVRVCLCLTKRNWFDPTNKRRRRRRRATTAGNWTNGPRSVGAELKSDSDSMAELVVWLALSQHLMLKRDLKLKANVADVALSHATRHRRRLVAACQLFQLPVARFFSSFCFVFIQ